MFEDVIPHRKYYYYCMVIASSTKGFIFKKVMIQWLLGVIYVCK